MAGLRRVGSYTSGTKVDFQSHLHWHHDHYRRKDRPDNQKKAEHSLETHDSRRMLNNKRGGWNQEWEWGYHSVCCSVEDYVNLENWKGWKKRTGWNFESAQSQSEKRGQHGLMELAEQKQIKTWLEKVGPELERLEELGYD